MSGRAAYDLWADTYPAVAHNPLMRIEQDMVGRILGHLRATRALDVGSGSGRYLPLLEATGATRVVALDFSLTMLAHGTGARRVCADACRLPFRRSAFDLVNASLMVGDVADLGCWAHEMARVLSMRGHLLYSDFHPSWAQHGWSRTFRTSDGTEYDLSFHPHSIDDHLAALEQAGFSVCAIREPRFGMLAHDDDGGIEAFRRRWGNPRVVVVFHAIKQS